MEIRDQLRKIEDCQTACINLDKRIDGLKLKEAIARIESLEDYTRKLSIGGYEELTIKVDNMKYFLTKVEQYWDPLVNKVAEHKASIGEFKTQVSPSPIDKPCIVIFT